jgi:hypothetical protein
VVRAAVLAEICDLLLEAGGRRRGGLLICIIKEAVLGFFSCYDGVLLDVGPYLFGR